jgi:hypothetical protein
MKDVIKLVPKRKAIQVKYIIDGEFGYYDYWFVYVRTDSDRDWFNKLMSGWKPF